MHNTDLPSTRSRGIGTDKVKVRERDGRHRTVSQQAAFVKGDLHGTGRIGHGRVAIDQYPVFFGGVMGLGQGKPYPVA